MTTESLSMTAQAIRDDLARRSFAGPFDQSGFLELLRDVKCAATYPNCCSAEVVKEVERLLLESPRLEHEQARRVLAVTSSPLSYHFDKTLWASEIAQCISSNGEHSSRVLQIAGWAGVKLDRSGLTALFHALDDDPRLTEHVIEFVLSGTHKSGMSFWPLLASAVDGCRTVEVFELTFVRFRKSQAWNVPNCCVRFCAAMTQIRAELWPAGRQEEILDLLWPGAASRCSSSTARVLSAASTVSHLARAARALHTPRWTAAASRCP